MNGARRLLAAALGVAALVSGCGYSSQRLVEARGARTVAVLAFENLGFRRDLELRLTQAVVSELRSRTSLAIGSPESADLILSGRMGADESVITLAPDRTALQQRLGGTLEITVTDRRTGTVVKRYGVQANTEFTPGRRGQSLEGSAADELVRRLAERVVQGLEKGF